MSNLTIYLIEDSLSFQKKIKNSLVKVLQEKFGFLNIDVRSINNVISFYNEIEKQQFSSDDIFIIDIDLNTYFDGIAMGNKIRRHSSSSKIMYLTSFENKAIEIINQNILPEGYVLKNQPIEQVTAQLVIILTHIISDYTNADKHLVVDTGYQKHIVPYDDILFVTIMTGMRNTLLLRSNKNEILFSGILSKVKKELSAPPFVLNLKSFIVNFDLVLRLNKNEGVVTFKNDLELFIGKQGIKKIEEYQKGGAYG